MDFFGAQEQARRKTRRLLILFGAAVLSLVVLTNLAVATALWMFDEGLFGTWRYTVELPALEGARPPRGLFAYLQPGLVLAITAGVTLAIALASLWKHVQLSGGGGALATLLGGSPIAPHSEEPAERRLLNVVEEMAIASGVPVPPVYLLPEPGINAFAAGYAPEDAVIGVTHGAVAALGRDELQGVMAHEFSHILNGDMRLNLRLIAVLNGILFIALAGRLLLHGTRGAVLRVRSGPRHSGVPLLLLGLALLVIGSGGALFARVIKAGVSRERELLADASAVQFTRNPLGLAGALKKIAALAGQGELATPRAEEASHLFFAQAIRTRATSLFATHPPLAERIRRLDPSWRGIAAADMPPRAVPQENGAGVALVGQAPAAVSATAALEITDAPPIDGIGAALRQACREPQRAPVVVLASLIDVTAPVAPAQRELLRRHGFVLDATLAAALEGLPDPAMLPVLELAMPALKSLDRAQRERLLQVLGELVVLDGHLDLREITAAALLERHLQARPVPVRARYARLDQLAPTLSLLFSALACAVPGDPAERFAAAVSAAGARGLRLMHPQQLDWPMLRTALGQLRTLYPLLKPRVLKGCRAALAGAEQDAQLAASLLAMLAATLDCPAVPGAGLATGA